MTAAAPTDADDLWPADERAERHLSWFKEIGELGMELLRELREDAVGAAPEGEPQTPPAPKPGWDVVGKAFHQISRAVRLTAVLEAQLAEEKARADKYDPDKRLARLHRRWAQEDAQRTPADWRRLVLKTVVPQMLQMNCEKETHRDYDELREAFGERLQDAPDSEILNRPMPELIELICRDLDIEPCWSLWKPRRWADPKYGLGPDELTPVGEKPRKPWWRPDPAAPVVPIRSPAA